MEFLVVADDELTRPGSRLMTVLERAHRCALLTPEQFGVSQEPGRDVGVIFLGDVEEAVVLRDKGEPRFQRHGISFGWVDNFAWVFGGPVDDPSGTLRAMAVDLEELQEVSATELQALEPQGTHRGVHFAGLYLDPYLPVAAATEVARRIEFTPERMCWERQYTLGIAYFLRDAFDAFAAELA